MRFILPSLVAISLVFGTAGLVSAQTGVSVDGSAGIQTDSVKLDSSVKAQIEADVKAENSKCLTIKDDAQRKACLSQLETRIRTKFPTVTNIDAIRDVIKKETKISTDDDDDRDEDRDDDKAFKNRLDKWMKHFEKVVKRLEASYSRINRLAERVESRMKKLSSEGVNVSASQKSVTSAREELRLAKASIEAARVSFKSELNASTNVTTTSNSSQSDFEKCKKANGGIILKTLPAQCVLNGVTYVDSSVNANLVYDKSAYEKCKANNGSIQETAPPRCVLGGVTYVNADDPVKKISVKNFNTAFAKTIANIKAAKDHLKKAHRHLAKAISDLKPGLNKDKSKTSTTTQATTTTN